MLPLAAWSVHALAAVFALIPGLIGFGLSTWAAVQLTGPAPKTLGAKLAVVLYLAVGLWPLAAWVGLGLWRSTQPQ